MSIFNQFPWTNYREYNLDWVIRTVKEGVATIQNTVQTYFAAHVDNTLSVSGDAADAATVGTRLTTVNGTLTSHMNEINTLKNTAVHYYRVTDTGGGILELLGNGNSDAHATMSKLTSDISNNYQYTIMLDGYPVDNIEINPNDPNQILFTTRSLNCYLEIDTTRGVSTAKTESLGTVAIQFNVISAGYIKGDYATLDAKLTAGYTSSITANASGTLNCMLIEAWKSGTTWILTIAGPSDTWQIDCADDNTVTVTTLP